jgi:dimethylglycine dehydrogenase
VDADKQVDLYHALAAAGAGHGMRPFGMRAMMSLRLDKFFGSWNAEFSPDYTAAETGMDRFVSYGKDAEFIGKAATLAERETGPARQLCAFEVDAEDADVVAYEPIWIDGKVVGFCTSGGYSHYAEKSIALGFVPTGQITDDLSVQIEILGKMCSARRLLTPPFDPDGSAVRG